MKTQIKFLKTHGIALLIIFGVSFIWAHYLYEIHSLRKEHPGFTQTSWAKIPNNGKLATSFAVHVHPHWLFSEDFHLYDVRAKRILDFGFVNDILEPTQAKGHDFRNFIQVAVTALPALWGRDIRNYAIIYFIYLALGLFLGYLVTSRWIKDKTFAGIIWGVIVCTAGLRFLRISTNLLSLPALLWGFLHLFRVLEHYRQGHKIRTRNWAGLSLILFLLSQWDSWAFSFLFFATLTFVALVFVSNVFRFFAEKDRELAWHKFIFSPLKSLFFFTIPMGLIVLLNWLLTCHLPRDVMMRAGFYNVILMKNFPWLYFKKALMPTAFFAAGILCVRRPKDNLFVIFALAAAGYLALLLSMIFILGVEDYQLSHFSFLYSIVSLWLFLIALAFPSYDLLKSRTAKISGRIMTARDPFAQFPSLSFRPWLKGIALCFFLGWTGFLYFEKQDILKYSYADFAIPRRYEELLDYVQKNVPSQKGKTFLTLSHEANYLLAYSTRFDLLLPEGFPLQSIKTNQEIITRFAAIANFLGLGVDRLAVFLQPQHPKDQELWIVNRQLAASTGYLYYLFHRYSLRPELENQDGKQGYWLKIGILSRVSDQTIRLEKAPDYILAEEVFRFLDLPVPQGYQPVFRTGEMTLYQKTE